MQDGDWDSRVCEFCSTEQGRLRIAWKREGRNKDERTGARTAGQDGSNLIKDGGLVHTAIGDTD
jgi:hypothetical protein